MATWKEDIITALINLNGKAHLSHIYKEVEKVRNGNLNPTWDRTVQRELESNSSDSKAFLGREDLFYSVEGKGKGVWGLRSMQEMPKYYIVFQGDTYTEEKELKCLWAPILDKSGKQQHHHKRLLDLKIGDRIVHLDNKIIKAISTVQGNAYNAECPREFKRAYWSREGRKVDLKIIELEDFIDISSLMESIKPYLPNIYSPFNKKGSGNQGYLFPINKHIFNIILNTDKEELNYDNKILSIPQGPSQTSNVKSNVRSSSWQKYFKNLLYEMWGEKCVLTGVKNKELLIGAHIKPYSKSNDKEKIDEYNGLILSPNSDKVFELGLISFADDGKLLISKYIDKNTLEKLNIDTNIKVNFKENHKAYLKYHREKKFRI